MSFVPAICVECWRVQLVALTVARGDALTCQLCGAAARIVPGCAYTAHDCVQFEELCEIVAEVHLTPAQGQQLAQETERALWSGAFTHSLEKLAGRMPGLVPMQSAAGRNSAAQQRILSQLKTILQALATARRNREAPVVAADPNTQRDEDA